MPWHAASPSPGPARLDVITPASCLPGSWSTSWLLGQPETDGQPQTPASAAELTTTPAHPLRAETPLDGELISRYDVPPSQHRCPGPGLSRCPLSTTGPLGGGHPCAASANQKSERYVVTIRVSRCERYRNQRPGPSIQPCAGTCAARVGRRWPPWCSAALPWSSSDDSPLWTLLVIVAAAAIAAAARRHRPKK